MRSALLCVFFALGVGKGGRQAGAANDFKPMPIPLDQWNYEFRAPRVGTLHEAVNTETPPSVAAVPAHYWEDALRHSVYLTLVRDKIDQLIAKGSVISPDSKPDQYNSKEVDDHDLWDKIKTAPFDRISETEHSSFGDVTIMAKGRLLEEKNGFRFTEDERKNEKCNDESCMKGVKAIWSVKRVRQRDEEVSPGKYHYELTFSVMSQAPKKQRKPYENPVRTFTVRENTPDTLLGRPQPAPYHTEPVRAVSARPQRAIWFHRNLAPSASTQSRRYHQSLDRIFLSLFSDDDSQPEPPRRPPMYSQYQQPIKGPHVGSSSEQYQQKKLLAYPYKPPVYKYVRGPLPAPPLGHHHFVDPVDNSFVAPPIDQRYVAPNNAYKTTRPAVLPTPLPVTVLPTTTKNFTYDLSNAHNYTESSTRETEADTIVHRAYSKPKPTPNKVNYLPDHIRPPVYNAPPGVFVTMDKKPFKPMPPLKILHTTKYKHRPNDFRPSPQLLDMQFSDPDSHSTVDTAFRPILMDHAPPENRTSPSDIHNNKKGEMNFRRPLLPSKRPPKKHGNIKAKPVTTSAPDIITVYDDNDLEDDTPEWANIVSAFPITAPIKLSKEVKSTTTESIEIVDTDETVSSQPSSSTETPSSSASSQTSKKKRVIKTSTSTEPSTTTTDKPRRTRPPPKFSKPEKIKKHKRVTSTTKSPVNNQVKSPGADLTPQASSAATRPNKPWESKNKIDTTTESSIGLTSSMPSTTTKTTTTTRVPTTPITTTSTTTAKPVTTTATFTTSGTTQPKNKNRFRQSTLMQKGTSVNHDKWSVVNTEKEKNKTIIPASGKFPPRRKGSNFQGHASTTQKSVDVDHKVEDHRDKKISTESTSTSKEKTTTQSSYEENAEPYNTQDQEEDGDENIEDTKQHGNEEDASDEKEYIFGLSSTMANEKANEISDVEDFITEETITTTIHSIPKNKTKCKKKKKHENLMGTSETENELTTLKQEPSTTTTSTSATDIFMELFGKTSYDGTSDKSKETASELEEGGSEKHENFAQIDNDFEDYVDELNKNKEDEQDVEQYEDESESQEENSPFDNESEDDARNDKDDDIYEDYHERSLSFLELMAME